jgi:CBS-domain-containing membrane protein
MSNKTGSSNQSHMKASDVMTSLVISVKAEASIMTAIRLMLQNHISGLPVTGSKGELVGIVTEGDFLRRGEIGTQRRRSRWLEFFIGPGHWADEYVHARGCKVAEVMTPEVITITDDTPLDEAVTLMERHRIKRLPVVRDGRVVGIVSRANIMHALVSLGVEAKSPLATTDASIRANILAECDKQPWRPLLNVVVRDHVVHLWGTLTDERERRALVVLAENVPGVQAVHDHMVWVEPTSGFAVESMEDEELERKAAVQTPTHRSEPV